MNALIEGRLRHLAWRKERYDTAMSAFLNAASFKEQEHQYYIEAKNSVEEAQRAEFEAAQAAAKADPKGGLALSIEKVFGTQGLELVQAAQQRFEELSKEPGPGREQFR